MSLTFQSVEADDLDLDDVVNVSYTDGAKLLRQLGYNQPEDQDLAGEDDAEAFIGRAGSALDRTRGSRGCDHYMQRCLEDLVDLAGSCRGFRVSWGDRPAPALTRT